VNGMIPRDLIARAERLAARAASLIPQNPLFRVLSTERAHLVDEICAARRAEIARVQASYLAAGKKRGRRSPAREQAEQALAALADDLIAELRHKVVRRAASPLLRLAAELDARLPTAAPEHMDRSDFDESARLATVREVDRWSRTFGSYQLFIELLAPLLTAGRKTLTVLDVASGVGGFPVALATALGAAAKVRIISSDVKPEYAQAGARLAAERGLPNLTFMTMDGYRLADGLGQRTIDVVTCTQALHHLGAGGTALLLGQALAVARRGLLFVDLTRSLTGFLAFNALGWLGGLDGIFRHDAVLSMRKAFVPEELALIARCVPGGERLEAFHVAPGFSVLRTRVS
jgi:SAM-dependent methyltransferase